MLKKEQYGEIEYSMFQHGTTARIADRGPDELEAVVQVVREGYVLAARQMTDIITAGFVHATQHARKLHVTFGFVFNREMIDRYSRQRFAVPELYPQIAMINHFHLAYAYYVSLVNATDLHPEVAVLHFEQGNLRRVIHDRQDIREEKSWLLYQRLNPELHVSQPIQLRRLASGEMSLPELLRESRPIMHTLPVLRSKSRALELIYSKART